MKSTQSFRFWFVLVLSLSVLAVSQSAKAQLAGTFRSALGTQATYEFDFGGGGSTLLPADVIVAFSNDTPTSSLTATIHRAIIGDLPSGPDFGIVNLFPMTVAGTSTDGRRFRGDLLGTQYLFDWTFDPAAGGELAWNGKVYWAGGHIEVSTIANARMISVPEPGSIALMLSTVVILMRRR